MPNKTPAGFAEAARPTAAQICEIGGRLNLKRIIVLLSLPCRQRHIRQQPSP